MAYKARLIKPSALKLSLSCTASAVLSRDVKFTQTLTAKYGVVKHDVHEKCLKDPSLDAMDFKGHREGTVILSEKDVKDVSKSVNYFRSLGFIYGMPETKVDISTFIGLQPREVVGYIDVPGYTPDGTLHIGDYKSGGVAVPANNNYQMLTYAIPMLYRVNLLFPVKRVALHIFQAGEPDVWHINPDGIKSWAKYLATKCATLKAVEAHYDATGEIDRVHYNPTPDNCRYCKAINCPSRFNT